MDDSVSLIIDDPLLEPTPPDYFTTDDSVAYPEFATVESLGGFIGGVIDYGTALDNGQGFAGSANPAAPSTLAQTYDFSFSDRGSDHRAVTRPFTIPNTPSKILTHVGHIDPAARHAANLISHMVGAFPQMMLRRHTFPPFIHPHWHLPAVPEILASCMGIAQLFVSRTPESRAFLWRTVDTEQQHFLDRASNQKPL